MDRMYLKRNASFSLLELMVVISILIIVLAITFPSLSFIEDSYLSHELDILYSTFCFMQKKAWASNQVQAIIFDIKDNSYSYKSLSGSSCYYKLGNNISFGAIKGAMGPPSSPKNEIKLPITFERLNEDKFIVKFFNNQIISSGTIYLVNKIKSKMVALSVPISQISLIRKYEFKHEKWKNL